MMVAFLGWSPAATADIYFSDFEADNGGWSGTGDWQWGTPVGANGTDLGGFGGNEPTGGFSGDNVWGTILGGLHNPSTVSNLTQTFDFSGFTGVSFAFQEWIDSGGNAFDTAEIFVNGNLEYFSDGLSNGDWREVVLDWSAYDGLSNVTVDFQFSTTGVVERVGWYLDDVSITGRAAIPEPASLGLLMIGLAGFATGRRRR